MRTTMSLATLFAVALPAFGATYYVDSVAGDDAAAGLCEKTAWKSLEKVNKADIQPGDTVRFKRGGLWRGSLVPHSGELGKPVTYTWYGTGPKPIFQQSVDRSKPGDWVETEPGVWATLPCDPQVFEQVWKMPAKPVWSPSFQNGYKGTAKTVTENGETFLRVTLAKKGPKTAPNYLQLWGPEMKDLPPCALLKFRVRATQPFSLSTVRVMQNAYPYTASHTGVVKGAKRIGTVWQDATVLFTAVPAKLTSTPVLHVNLGDVLPEGGQVDLQVAGVWRATMPTERMIERDVGIFIVNHGEKWGVKKWGIRGPAQEGWDVSKMKGRWPDSVKFVNELDYWYDGANKRVFVKCDRNPGEKFASIELAKTTHIIAEGGKHDVTYDGLWVRYGAAHGFGGGSVSNLVIRNCDISWIGGGLQFWRKHEKTGRIVYPVRFGNGIEFWGNCRNCLIERCRLWEIYDAALTNQGRYDTETEVTWRDNVIWNSEYSYEYWNAKLTRNILFEHNTCVDAGYGWAHAQRPDINGAHLMYYHNRAATTNFVVRNNIFCRATEWTCRSGLDWRYALTHDHNLVWNEGDIPYIHWLGGKDFRKLDWKGYQGLGFDPHGLNAEPKFANPAKRDYRLTKDSPGYAGLSSDGTPVGARNMPGLDEDQSLPEKGFWAKLLGL